MLFALLQMDLPKKRKNYDLVTNWTTVILAEIVINSFGIQLSVVAYDKVMDATLEKYARLR